MKRGISLYTAVVLIMVLLCGCGSTGQVKLNKEDSWFSDFTVDDGQVYMTCALVIENSTGGEVKVKITASSPEDVDGGLLQSTELTGKDERLSSDEFTLQEGENTITVVFVGTFGGTEAKQNRLLPEDITLTVVG